MGWGGSGFQEVCRAGSCCALRTGPPDLLISDFRVFWFSVSFLCFTIVALMVHAVPVLALRTFFSDLHTASISFHSARDRWRLKKPAEARIACSKVAFLTDQSFRCTKCKFSKSNLIFKTSLNFEHL